MTTVRVVRLGAAFTLGAMLAGIVGAVAVGDLRTEGAALVATPWGRLTLVDAYLAFGIGWAWIALRERHPARAAAWAAAVAVTGSLPLAAYAFGASLRADDVPQLLLGPREDLRTAGTLHAP